MLQFETDMREEVYQALCDNFGARFSLAECHEEMRHVIHNSYGKRIYPNDQAYGSKMAIVMLMSLMHYANTTGVIPM
jgi:hypothetical protein